MSPLELSLDTPGKVFTNGDIILGSVKLSVAKRASLKKIMVELVGVSECRSGKGSSTTHIIHRILQREVKVFPDIDVEGGSKKSFTLSPGVYDYRFSLALPSENTMVDCLQKKLEKKQNLQRVTCDFHSDVSANDIKTAPPSFLFGKGFELAQVSYYVQAKGHKSNFFSLNFRSKVKITYMPSNRDLSLWLDHIRDYEQLLPDSVLEQVNMPLMKFDNEAPKSLWKKITTSSKVSIPIYVSFEFLPSASFHTQSGTSQRFLRNSSSLAQFFQVSFVSPLSPEDISRSLAGESKNLVPLETININDIKINLIEEVEYKTDDGLIYYGNQKRVLLEKTLNISLAFDDFEATSSEEFYSSYRKNVPYDEIVYNQSKVVYKYDMPCNLYECLIPECCPSFVCCKIKHNFILDLRMSLSASSNPNKAIDIKKKLPVMILNCESSSAPAYTAQPLEAPAFEAPPVYS